MKKALAWGVGVVVAVPVVLAATAFVLVNTIDQQALLNKASEVVEQKQQRKLAFNGPVTLRWFPSIGAELNQVSLTEFQSDESFVKADKVDVSLALLPLLRSQVVVDAVKVDGLTVQVTKNREGKFNFDDLVAPPAEEEKKEAAPVAFSVDSLDLRNVNLRFIDQQADFQASLNNFELQTGRIEEGVPSQLSMKGQLQNSKPKADLNFDVNTRFEFALGEAMYANFEKLRLAVLGTLDGQQADITLAADTLAVNPQSSTLTVAALAATAKGALPDVGAFDVKVNAPALALTSSTAKGEALEVQANLKQAARTIDLKLNLAQLAGNLQESLSANLSTELGLQEGERKVALKLASPLAVQVQGQVIELASLNGQLDVNDPLLPKKSASMPINGSARVDNKAQTARLQLASKFEATQFDLNANVRNFSKPQIVAALNADQLDIDALLPPKPAGAASPAPESKPAQGGQQDTPIDLSPLKNLDLDFTAKVGSLKASNIKLAQLNTRAVAKGGVLTVSPLSANLYGGSMAGSVVANANTNAISIDQRLAGVQIGPVLRDVADKDILEGKGNVDVKLNTRGASVNALRAALNGNLAVRLEDGAVKGINLAETIRNARNLLTGGASNSTANSDAAQKTDFSSMSVSFNVVNGVASSNDLNLMAPLFRVGGQGQFNLVNETMDYLANATVVATSTGQGGKTLDSGLRGLTIPVRLYGPFTAPKWELKFGDLAKEAAKAKVEEKKEELQQKVEERREELKGQAQEKARDALRGLLNR